MLALLTLLLLPLPVLFQYKVGRLSLAKTIKIPFIIVCLSSLVLEVFITYWVFWDIVEQLSQSDNHCATAAVGILFMGFVLTLLILVLMIKQWIDRKSYTN